MFVPSKRLLIFTASTMGAGLFPMLFPEIGWSLFLLALILLAGLALIDYAISYEIGKDLRVKPMAEIRLRRDEPRSMKLAFCHKGNKPRELEAGLALPLSIQAGHETFALTVPPGTPEFSVPFTLTARRRGLFQVDTVHCACLSYFGLWEIRRVLDCPLTIRVLANLKTVQSAFANLFLNRGDHGAHAQRQLGRGREFEQLRDYLPGDSSEDIHWKATAKRGEPVTKLYRVERTQEVYVVLDASRLSQMELPNATNQAEAWPDSIFERYVTAASVLALAAGRQGDHFGLASFSDHLELFIRAKNGRAHQQYCQEALARRHPRAVTPDFGDVISSLRLQLHHRALVIFLTDLSDPVAAETFSAKISILARQHHVIAVMIIPASMRPLFQGDSLSTDDEVYARLAGHLQWQGLRQTQLTLKRHGVALATATEENLAATVVNRYIHAKQRQLV